MNADIERRIVCRCAGDFAEPRAGHHDRPARHAVRSRKLQKRDVGAVTHADVVDMEYEHSRTSVACQRLRDGSHSRVAGA